MGKKRAILLVALLAIAGGGAAAYFTRGSSDGDAESVRKVNDGQASGRTASSTDSLVAEITATIYQMDRLQLDPAIFNSAAFRVLQDRTQTIVPQEPGRENPFAPLYSDAATSSASRTRAPSTGGGLINSNRTSTGGTAGTPPALPVR